MIEKNLSYIADIIRWVVIGGLGLFAITTVGGITKDIKDYLTDSNLQTTLALKQEYQQLADNVARAQTEMVDNVQKILDSREKELKVIVNALKESKAKPTTISTVTTQFNAGLSRELKQDADKVYTGKSDTDPNAYYFKWLYLHGKDDDGESKIPIAWTQYFPNRDENQFSTGVEPIELTVDMVRAQRLDGGYESYAQAYARSNRGDYKDTKVPIKIRDFQVKEQILKEKHFFLWNPAIHFGAAYTSDNVLAPSLGVSLISYGRTKVDSSWYFLGVHGVFNENHTKIAFEPFAYNLGEPLPLITNLTIGPIGTYDFTDGDIGFGIRLGIRF